MTREEAARLMQPCLRNLSLKLTPKACEKRRSVMLYGDPKKKSDEELGIELTCKGCEGLPMKRKNIEPKANEPVCEPVKMETCPDCGKQFERYKHGMTYPKICTTCMVKRTKAGVSRGALERRVTESSLLIDFGAEDRSILDRLREVAKQHRRTPEMQAICILEAALGKEV